MSKKRAWYVLEWNALDDDIDLFVWDTTKTDEAEVWEEVGEGLHNWSNFLVMNEKRLLNLFRVVAALQELLRGGSMNNA